MIQVVLIVRIFLLKDRHIAEIVFLTFGKRLTDTHTKAVMTKPIVNIFLPKLKVDFLKDEAVCICQIGYFGHDDDI